MELVKDIEDELKKYPALYPGNIPTMFKNMMVAEIMMKSGGSILRLEKDIDVGHKK